VKTGTAERERARRGIRLRRAEVYRAAVLEAGERVFAEQGFEAARMQDVAAAAGVALATLYTVFPGKAELFAAIHERRGRELLESSTGDAVAVAGNPVAVLLEGVSRYVGYLVAHPQFLRMHLYDGAAWAMPGRNLRSDEQRLAWSTGVAAMAGAVAAGMEQGLFVTDEPERVAKMMIAMQQVQLADWIESGAGADPEEMIERSRALLVRAFCTERGRELAAEVLAGRGV
jgi:AcrR family transcriptional regulator